MKITVLQTDIAWTDVAENLRRADSMLEEVADGTDLIVLPEMFSTGFAVEPSGIAEDDGGQTLLWMRRTAERRQCAVAGSVAVHSDGAYFNRFYFVEPDGRVSTYDKRHLFSYGGEDRHFSPGACRTVVCYRGVRIMLQVCYDLRFPVFSRNRGDYDVLIYVANWPVARIAVWDTLLRARALENQCYVVGVNRVGHDIYCEYPGHSAVFDAMGHTVAQCGDMAGHATAVLHLEALKSFRQKFPVLGDADAFSL